MTIKPDLPNVIVLPITSEHKEVLTRLRGGAISRNELLCTSVRYWLNNIRPFSNGQEITVEDEDVWDDIHEALWAAPEWQKEYLAAIHETSIAEALSTECDMLSHEVMQIGEDLGSILALIGEAAEGISHICRVEWDDFGLYLYCHYNWRNNERVSGF